MQTSPLLIVVFPEEACNTASKILDERTAARFREHLGNFARGWQGSVWVINGPSLDAMASDPLFDLHMTAATRPVGKRWPMPRFSYKLKSQVADISGLGNIKNAMRSFRLSKRVPVTIAGCWTNDDRTGAIDRMASMVKEQGYTVEWGPKLTDPYASPKEDDMIYENRLMMETETPPKLLVLVHPGSACGSANSNIGRGEAENFRRAMADDLRKHSGHFLVVDGDASSDLPYYGFLNTSISECLTRNGEAGFHAVRVFACDDYTDGWEDIVTGKITNMGLQPTTPVELTGAWYCEDDSAGCVNAVNNDLTGLGFKCVVLDSAARDPEGDLDQDEDGPEDDESEEMDDAMFTRLRDQWGD